MRHLTLLGLALACLPHCRNHPGEGLDPAERKTLFLPAVTYIGQELQAIDSLPVAVIRYRNTGSRRDTAIVPKAGFRTLMQGWFGETFADAPTRHPYRRKVFHDATLGRVTITCDTDDATAPIQRLDLLIDPETDAVRSLYAERSSTGPDGTPTRQKLLWSSGRQCRITLERAANPRQPATEDILYTWGVGQP